MPGAGLRTAQQRSVGLLPFMRFIINIPEMIYHLSGEEDDDAGFIGRRACSKDGRAMQIGASGSTEIPRKMHR